MEHGVKCGRIKMKRSLCNPIAFLTFSPFPKLIIFTKYPKEKCIKHHFRTCRFQYFLGKYSRPRTSQETCPLSTRIGVSLLLHETITLLHKLTKTLFAKSSRIYLKDSLKFSIHQTYLYYVGHK